MRESSTGIKSEFAGLQNVTVRAGDLRDPVFVDSCIAGQDIVMSALGNRLPSLAYWNKPVCIFFEEPFVK